MKRWYVVRSKHRHEVLLWHQLCSRGIEAYFPRIDSNAMAAPLGGTMPLFPGYMFVRVDLGASARSALLWMPGADGFVCVGGKPAFISDRILRSIQAGVDRLNRTLREPSAEGHHRTGTRSEFESFAGYRGMFETARSHRERSAALIRFIRDQQIPAQFPTTAWGLTGDGSGSTLAPHGLGTRSHVREASRWRGKSPANYREGLRLESPREEASPPS